MLSARVLGVCLLASAALPYWHHCATGSKMSLFVSCMLLLFGCAACIRIRANPTSLSGKHVLVTGCDAGIGLALCQRLLQLGAVVYAGCLSTESEGARSLRLAGARCLQMDVTSKDQVAAAFDEVDENLGDAFLWAVVNNAGVQYSGDLELTTMDQFRRVMEVNYFGLLQVTKQFLPLLRERSGRLISVSSVRGRCSWPLTSGYSASKFAAEAAMDALRTEVARFGVSVVQVEPSHFGGATGMLSDSARIGAEFREQWLSAEPHVQEAYGEEYAAAVQRRVLLSAGDSATSLQSVTDGLVEALATDAPRDRYLISGTNSRWLDEYRWLAVARDWLPASLHDQLIGWRSMGGLPLPRAAEERLRLLRRPMFQ